MFGHIPTIARWGSMWRIVSPMQTGADLPAKIHLVLSSGFVYDALHASRPGAAPLCQQRAALSASLEAGASGVRTCQLFSFSTAVPDTKRMANHATNCIWVSGLRHCSRLDVE